MNTSITAILGLILIGARMAQAQFTYSTNGRIITVTSYTGPDGAVTIPNFVHSIGDFACQGNTNITSLVISDSVTNMGEFAFGECSSLGSVIIGHGLGTIGYAAFENCDSLTSVAMSDSVTNIDDGAFLDSISMTSVTIPGSVVRIGNGAFYNAALTSITIPEGVATIGDAAFYNARLVGTVTIPASVSSIGEAPFEISEQLTAIYVEPGNLYYSSQGGVLFDHSGTTLIECPGGESGWPPSSTPYVIPSSVTTLAPDAFGFCNLYGVVIPDSVTNIEDRAFYACESLTGITIPDSVTSIGSAVFAGCYALTSINVNSGNRAYVSVSGVLHSRDQTSLIAYPPSEDASSYSVSAGVTSIEDRAFESCQNLTNIVIPNSVTNLGFNAMAYCNNLTAVYFEGNAPAFESIGFFNDGSVGGSPFDDDSDATAYYLAGARGWGASYGGAPTAELTAISLSAAPTNGRAPLTVDFTSSNLDQSNNPITNWDWDFNDGLTSVEQNPSHTFTTYGSYAVALVETNSDGVPVAGSAVTVNVLGTPVITSQPSAQTSRLGGSVVLQVQASGAAPLTYQWKFDNAELSNGAHISGATSNVLTLSDLTTANTGSYMVIVRNQYGSITSALTVVTILPQGNPKLTFASPKGGQSVSNALLLVNGTVTDKVAVRDVYYQLNGGGWTPATTTNSWSTWTASVTLNPAANTLSAYAVDTSGTLSPTNSVALKFIPSATLIVQTNGLGGIIPVENGKLLAIGTNYTLTASPGKNWLFSNWVARGGENFVSNNPVLKFTMQSNLILQANFVPNPLIPQQGTFNGLFMDTNEVTEASSGFFTLALTATGSFTGKIMTSGNTYNLPTKTPFDVAGQVQFTVPTKQNALTFNLQLDIGDPSTAQITGTVSDGTWTAGLTADRAVFSTNSKKAVNYEGQYTLAIAGSYDAAASPGGFGCATLSINSAGLITMLGNLADGTGMAQSVSVSKDGRWPFYAAYAAPPAGNGGSVISWITFSNQPASTLGGTMYWFRPAGKTPALYRSGFTNTASIIGSAYSPTDKPLLALTNGQVTFDGGDLPFAITNQTTLSPAGAFTDLHNAENTNKLVLTINKTTGAISGSFANPSNTKDTIKISGVLLQNQTDAVGYFLGTNQSGAFLLENP